MASIRATILNIAYEEYQNGINLHNIPFNALNGTKIEIRNTFDNLENQGLINIKSFALGYAVIELTDYGITCCGGTTD